MTMEGGGRLELQQRLPSKMRHFRSRKGRSEHLNSTHMRSRRRLVRGIQ
jgi:hypothetical protein